MYQQSLREGGNPVSESKFGSYPFAKGRLVGVNNMIVDA